MRVSGLLVWAGLLGAGGAAVAQVAPPSIVREDCSVLKGKSRQKCEARAKAADDASAAAAKTKAADVGSDMPTGADADVPGEPASAARPGAGAPQSGGGALKPKPDTSDMPAGKDADPPAESMGPLKPDGTPDTDAPRAGAGSGGSSSSSSSSSSSGAGAANKDEDDAAPTTAGGDSPVKPSSLKDLGSHADTSVARAKLEANRVADDVKVGRYYMQGGNFPGAEKRFQDALAHDPEDPEAHFAMAELLLKLKRNDEASAQLKTYLALAPDDDHTKEAKKLLAKLRK